MDCRCNEARCPACTHLLMRVTAAGAAEVETKCPSCGAMLVVRLAEAVRIERVMRQSPRD